MKKLLTICLWLATSCVFAQADSTQLIAKKGYYAIGNNYKKLPAGFFRRADTFKYPAVRKGYYSIGNNNQLLGKQAVWFRRNTAPPVITKGYYSIGNNARKLPD